MVELRARTSRFGLALIIAAFLVTLILPWPTVGWGWILGMSASMVGNLMLHNWVKIVIDTGSKKSLAAIFQGYGFRTTITLGVLAVAYVYPNSFDLIATGIGVISFPVLIYLVAFWYGSREA